MNQIAEAMHEGDVHDGERLHISGLLVTFVSGLPQLAFPLVAAVYGVRQSKNPALIPIVIAAVLIISGRMRVGTAAASIAGSPPAVIAAGVAVVRGSRQREGAGARVEQGIVVVKVAGRACQAFALRGVGILGRR